LPEINDGKTQPDKNSQNLQAETPHLNFLGLIPFFIGALIVVDARRKMWRGTARMFHPILLVIGIAIGLYGASVLIP
jgi:hypothetical protein